MSSETITPKPRRRTCSTNPAVSQVLRTLGQHVRVARVSRDITLSDAAVRSGISAQTLSALEQGAPGVSLEAVALILWQMNLLPQLAAVADPNGDEEGRRLAALRAPARARGGRNQSSAQKADWARLGIESI